MLRGVNVDVEIVLLAAGDPAALDAAVMAVHRQLCAQVGKTWYLTIAVDDANMELHTAALEAAEKLPSMSVRTLAAGLDQKGRRLALTSSAAGSRPEGVGRPHVTADVVAFLRTSDDADWAGLLAPIFRTPVRPCNDAVGPRLFSRRHALGLLGGASVTAVFAACSSSTSTADATAVSADVSAPTSGATATAVKVELASEMTEGPYDLDLNMVRSNIVEDRTGAALAFVVGGARRGHGVTH